MSTEIVRVAESGLAHVQHELTVEDLIAHVQKIQAVMQRVMREGEHYGVIPGTIKPTLLKPGAEMLLLTFRFDPQYSIEKIVEGDHLTILSTCTLYHIPTGQRMGSGMGSCSTRESRYAYRQASRSCPKCGSAAIIAGKAEYGGGWLCFKKKGGCGAKYADKDPAITEQATGRVENEDRADQYNTVLKMSNKRALVAAVLNVTAASEIFTQDVEDLPRAPVVQPEAPPAPAEDEMARHLPPEEVYPEVLNAEVVDPIRVEREATYARVMELKAELVLGGDTVKALWTKHCGPHATRGNVDVAALKALVTELETIKTTVVGIGAKMGTVPEQGTLA